MHPVIFAHTVFTVDAKKITKKRTKKLFTIPASTDGLINIIRFFHNIFFIPIYSATFAHTGFISNAIRR